jgi:hypothetical protein
METLARAANRGSISTGYDIDNSLKFEADNSEYLSRTPSSAGNRRTWTLSCWIKRTELASSASMQILSAGDTYLHFAGDRLAANFRSASENFFFGTNRVFRDTSAWYHIVLQCDTTQATATDRAKLWVNGEAQTADWLNSYDNMSQNYETLMNSTSEHEVGKYVNDESTYAEFFNGYMAEMHLVDGTALEPTDFGETDEDSGIWKPKAYTGSYGTNGFYLDFSDSANLGNDASGGLDFTETNITSADQATDTPTNNFATGNPLVYFSNPTMATFNAITEGATQFKKGANGWETMTSSIAVTSGKWYMELQNISVPEAAMMAILPVDAELIFRGGRVSYHPGASSGDGGVAQYSYNGTLYKEGVGITYSPSPTWANGTDVMGIALDMDNGKVYFAKGNTWMNNGDPTTGSTGTGAVDIPDYTTKPYVFGYSLYSNNTNGRMNFGGYTSGSISSAETDENGYGTFEYAPPTGYYALCTKNLAEFG